MIESHIYVIITCDNCGATQDFEQYDETTTDTVIAVATSVDGWEVKDQVLCPDCKKEFSND